MSEPDAGMKGESRMFLHLITRETDDCVVIDGAIGRMRRLDMTSGNMKRRRRRYSVVGIALVRVMMVAIRDSFRRPSAFPSSSSTTSPTPFVLLYPAGFSLGIAEKTADLRRK